MSGLRKRDINQHITNLFSGGLKNQVSYLENVARELEARKTKSAKTLYRRNLIDGRNRENYYNELHRIRGELSQNDTRLPIGTRERLIKRIEDIKKLKYDAFDSLGDIHEDVKDIPIKKEFIKVKKEKI